MQHKCVMEPITAALYANGSVGNASSPEYDFAKWIPKKQKEWNEDVNHWYPPDPANFLMCGKDAGECPTGYKCIENVAPNPNFGYTNFGESSEKFINFGEFNCEKL